MRNAERPFAGTIFAAVDGTLHASAPEPGRHTEVPPFVFTSAAAAPETRRVLGDLAEVIDVSGSDPASLELARAVTVLADRGLGRVLAEGGPGILGRLISDGLLDELCLTVAPVLVEGAAGRIVTGDDDHRTPLHLQQVLGDDDGYLFLRYARAAADR